MTARSYGVTVRRSAPLRLPMHAEAPDPGAWRTWLTESDRPIAVDLFSGAGGLSQGLADAGYQVALSVDMDDWALETHAHNFPGSALSLDLASKENRDGLVALLDGIEVDLVAGGPPCQPFSRAGRSKIRSLVDQGVREEKDVRKELWRAFVDVVERVRPKAVLMENVPDMALGDDMAVLRHIIDRLEVAGYEVDARIVDTWLYGVPQHRQRLILVGVQNGGSFEWPDAVDKVTVEDAISDLPTLEVAADTPVGAEAMPYTSGSPSAFALRARQLCADQDEPVVYDHLTRAVRADDLEAFSLMKAGTLYSDLPKDLQRYRDDIFDDKYNRLGWDELSRSITAHIAKDGYWYIHPDQHRTLTVREAARIQTFPDHFRFAGTRSHQFHQIGNAVPPALAQSIGASILKATASKTQVEPRPSARRSEFRSRLESWAEEDRAEALWAYPGNDWAVAVGLVVGSKGDTDWPTPRDVLGIAPTLDDVNPRLLSTLQAMTKPGRRRATTDRLSAAATAARLDADGLQGESWARAAGLGPAARAWFRTLTGQSSGLVASTAVLRVTARVTGTDVDRQNRNSAGRMELAKLIGGGDAAATLNAAMHRLGATVCTIEKPSCDVCPIRSVCALAGESTSSSTPEPLDLVGRD